MAMLNNQMVDHVPKGLKSLGGLPIEVQGIASQLYGVPGWLDSLGFPGKLGIAGKWGKFGDDFAIFLVRLGDIVYIVCPLCQKKSPFIVDVLIKISVYT
jgi:hypothetical protein